MKATLENLKKALEACAKAHKAEFCDWSDEGQWAIRSESVPVVADVRMICEAFFGDPAAVYVGWGYTNVYYDDVELLHEVNEALLALALPHGTKL